MPHILQVQQQQRQCDEVLYRSDLSYNNKHLITGANKDPADNRLRYFFLFFFGFLHACSDPTNYPEIWMGSDCNVT